jgi:hypothetical protein
LSEPARSLQDAQAEESLREGLRWSEDKGKPLPRRFRTGATTLESYLQAAGGGLAYMQRLRQIEDEVSRHERQAARARTELEAAYAGEPERLQRVWRRVAEEWDFSRVNELVDRHNRFYPVEARLAMDPYTGDYAKVGGESYRRAHLDPAWILDRA